jgi:hypothetical protein
VTGAYSIVITEGAGAGCGDLNPNAPQCIRAPVSMCNVILSSLPPNTMVPAINGTATIQSDGSFSGATLREGSAAMSRTGCTGTWNAAMSTMTVDCGGTGSSQACVVQLTRTRPICG